MQNDGMNEDQTHEQYIPIFPEKTGEQERVIIRQIFIQIIKAYLDIDDDNPNAPVNSSIIFVIDNMEMLDEISWRFTTEIFRQIHAGVMLVGIIRTNGLGEDEAQNVENWNNAIEDIETDDDAKLLKVEIERMDSGDILKLLMYHYGVEEIEADVVSLVAEKTAGNPYSAIQFIE